MDMLGQTAVQEAGRPAEKVLDLPAGRQGVTSNRPNSNAENPRKTSVLLNTKVIPSIPNDRNSKTFEALPVCFYEFHEFGDASLIKKAQRKSPLGFHRGLSKKSLFHITPFPISFS
jgi:hypothetical protein